MADAKNQIAFEQAGLGSILKHHQLVVPPNQRDYAWIDRQVKQLFQDYAKAIADGEQGYFLGTIVTIPRVNDTIEVVDGQQRLATTAILLAAIRDYLRGKEDVLVESINNEFLTGIDRVKRARVPRLRLNIDDNDLFTWIIARPGTPEPPSTRESHDRLKAAFGEAQRHIRNIVSGLDPRDHGDILNSWVSFIEHRALAVMLKVPDDANAYKMFETLNDRGLRVSQADLIKNYLFGRSGARFQEAASRWAFMRGALETLDEDDTTVTFLRYALITMHGYLREVQVYDKVQEVVKGEQGAITFISILETLANSYVATFNPEHDKWNSYSDTVRRAIEVFNLLNIKPMRPLLLAVATRFSEKEAAHAFKFLISLGVRLLIASTTRSGSVELPLAGAANAAFKEEIATARDLKHKLQGITPTDDEFYMAFEIMNVSKANLARYYLRSLEMAAKGEAEPCFMPNDDRAIINLEHILPRKPAANWPNFNDEEVAIYSRRVGNVTLLRAKENSDLRSDAFRDKKKVYKHSPFVLTSQVAEVEDWTTQAIVNRQRLLGKLALKAWPV